MINYIVKTGCKFLNTKAKQIINLAYKNQLKGMRCKKCKTNTLIEFIESDLTHVKPIITPCCYEFDKRIRKNLNK